MPLAMRRQALPHTQPDASQSIASVCPVPVGARIVVLNSNRLLGDLLRSTLHAAFVSATMIAASSLGDVDEILAERAIDLLVTDISAGDGDTLDRISSWDVANGSAKRALIVTAHNEPVVVHTLMHLPVGGVFNTAADDAGQLNQACSEVMAGGTYWSANVREAFLQSRYSSKAIFRQLTPTEQMVLGVIGDGCDDETAATVLPLKANSIRNVREALHHKFGVQHKGQLMERAAHYGFVVRTSDGLVRPGLKPLIAAHRKPTRFPTPPALKSVA